MEDRLLNEIFDCESQLGWRENLDPDLPVKPGCVDHSDSSEVDVPVIVHIDLLIDRTHSEIIQIRRREIPEKVNLLLRQESRIGHPVRTGIVHHAVGEQLSQAQKSHADKGDAYRRFDQRESFSLYLSALLGISEGGSSLCISEPVSQNIYYFHHHPPL
jgi:hypothetical protein